MIRRLENQRGVGGILGLVLGLAAMLILALLLMQARGLLGLGKKGEESSPMDQARIAAARTELHSVRLALQAWHDDEDRFPETGEVASLEDLRKVLQGRLFLPEEPAWTFVSYASPEPDRYLMSVRTRDGARTLLGFSETKAPEVITP
jgi:hypothetical protein